MVGYKEITQKVGGCVLIERRHAFRLLDIIRVPFGVCAGLLTVELFKIFIEIFRIRETAYA